jgi:hypothetical protein
LVIAVAGISNVEHSIDQVVATSKKCRESDAIDSESIVLWIWRSRRRFWVGRTNKSKGRGKKPGALGCNILTSELRNSHGQQKVSSIPQRIPCENEVHQSGIVCG